MVRLLTAFESYRASRPSCFFSFGPDWIISKPWKEKLFKLFQVNMDRLTIKYSIFEAFLLRTRYSLLLRKRVLLKLGIESGIDKNYPIKEVNRDDR